jgi:hypothetical protein
MSKEKESLEISGMNMQKPNNNRRHYSNLRFAVFGVFFAVFEDVVGAFGIVEIKSPTSSDIALCGNRGLLVHYCLAAHNKSLGAGGGSVICDMIRMAVHE